MWSLGVLLYEMCALKPPFNGSNIHMLAMQIVRGQFPALPATFSYELRALVNKLITQDPNRRPNINQVLKDRLLAPRIKKFLGNECFKEEFAHTILHKQNVFERAQQHLVKHLERQEAVQEVQPESAEDSEANTTASAVRQPRPGSPVAGSRQGGAKAVADPQARSSIGWNKAAQDVLKRIEGI